jgi:hypothetical protein
VNDPSARKKNREEINEDRRKSAALLKLLPDAFQFTRDGRQGKFVRLKFQPDPGFRPLSNEAKVFHRMEGILLIDARQIRLAKLSGTLMSDVEFGFAILGKLCLSNNPSEVPPHEATLHFWCPQSWVALSFRSGIRRIEWAAFFRSFSCAPK